MAIRKTFFIFFQDFFSRLNSFLSYFLALLFKADANVHHLLSNFLIIEELFLNFFSADLLANFSDHHCSFPALLSKRSAKVVFYCLQFKAFIKKTCIIVNLVDYYYYGVSEIVCFILFNRRYKSPIFSKILLTCQARRHQSEGDGSSVFRLNLHFLLKHHRSENCETSHSTFHPGAI